VNKREKYKQTLRELSSWRSSPATQRVKAAAQLYGAFVSAVTGVSCRYNVRSPKLRTKFNKIVENCKKLNIDERTYFEVMFREPVSEEHDAGWPYPPLNWLGTDRAREIFEIRWKELRANVAGTRMTIAEYLQTISFLNVKQHFSLEGRGCFYEGVSVVHDHRLYAQNQCGGWGWLDLLVVLVSERGRVFTDYFLATSPVVKVLPKMRNFRDVHIYNPREMHDVFEVWNLMTREPLKRLRNEKWRKRVMQTRQECKEEQRRMWEHDFAHLTDEYEEDWEWL